MKQKVRDVILAILSVGGIFYLVGIIYGSIIELIMKSVSLDVLKYLVILESLIVLIFGLLVWKRITLSNDYSKYFIILFIATLIIDLVYKIVVLF